MKTIPDPARENGAYKWFIEELATVARISIEAKRIRTLDDPNKTWHVQTGADPEQDRKYAFLRSLDHEGREIVARMIEHATIGAVHNVASMLDGYLSTNELTMSAKGIEIPASPYETMNYDLICILEGDEWPDE